MTGQGKNSDKKSKIPTAPGLDESPWPKRLGIGAAVVVVLALISLMLLNTDPEDGIPEGTEVIAVADPAHVDGTIYGPDEVPAGGPHNPIWQNCGYYDSQVRAENVVHSMEHAAVWITYSADIDPSDAGRLKRFTGRAEKVVVSLVAGQDSPYIATAWGYQLKLSDQDDSRLAQFVTEFEGSRQAPEPGGSCQGGVGTPSG